MAIPSRSEEVVFNAFDSDNDGLISVDDIDIDMIAKLELGECVRGEEACQGELAKAFRMIDTDNDGLINFEEFSALVAHLESSGAFKKSTQDTSHAAQDVREAFNRNNPHWDVGRVATIAISLIVVVLMAIGVVRIIFWCVNHGLDGQDG